MSKLKKAEKIKLEMENSQYMVKYFSKEEVNAPSNLIAFGEFVGLAYAYKVLTGKQVRFSAREIENGMIELVHVWIEDKKREGE